MTRKRKKAWPAFDSCRLGQSFKAHQARLLVNSSRTDRGCITGLVLRPCHIELGLSCQLSRAYDGEHVHVENEHGEGGQGILAKKGGDCQSWRPRETHSKRLVGRSLKVWVSRVAFILYLRVQLYFLIFQLSLSRQMFEFPSGFSALAKKKKQRKKRWRAQHEGEYIRNAAKPTFCKKKLSIILLQVLVVYKVMWLFSPLCYSRWFRVPWLRCASWWSKAPITLMYTADRGCGNHLSCKPRVARS